MLLVSGVRYNRLVQQQLTKFVNLEKMTSHPSTSGKCVI